MSRELRANALLLLTSMIWGSTFVAQRVGMEHMGPLTFNAARFLIGAAVLVPLIRYLRRRSQAPFLRLAQGGLLLGGALFMGAWLQQFGLIFTTAGKAGFITGLYVVVVPVFGLFLGHRYGWETWAGAGLAVLGLYLLSVTSDLRIAKGDLLVLASAFFWGIHVLLVDRLSRGLAAVDAICLAALQFMVCGVFSLGGALLTEKISLTGLHAGLFSLLYSGVLSVGLAYTMQVVAQRDARPAPAAIILSLETVFAALTGWLFLGEILNMRGLIGCALMLAGMIWSQTRP